MNIENLWGELTKNNIVSGQIPEQKYRIIPWYIRFIQGFAGWLSAFFIMGFFGLSFGFIFKQPTGSLVVVLGLLCNIAAYVLIKLRKNDFVDQVGMAFGLCGQLLLFIGLFFFMKINTTTAAFVLGFYQLFLAWIIPQYVHRLLSTTFGLLALMTGLSSMGFYGIGSALIAVMFSFIWLKEQQWGKHYLKWEAIGYGGILTVILSSGFLVSNKYLLRELFHNKTGWLFEHTQLVSSLLIALVLANFVFILLKENKVKLNSKTAIMSTIAAFGLVLISYKIYGLSIGILTILIGFARHRKVLIAIGIFSVMGFFSWYYYNLDVTLLYKSIVLIVLGVSTIVAWMAFNFIYNDSNRSKTQFLKLAPIKKTKYLTIATILLTLVTINVQINKKETLIETGEVLLLKLAPVDPRSLMQGDYMRLRFQISSNIIAAIIEKNKQNTLPLYSQGKVIVEKNEDNIATFITLYEEQPLKQNQRLMPYTYRNGQIKFTTNAFFFQEGQAAHFQQSEYGEFKLSEDGDILLVHMLDKELQNL